jgi:uncharacterized phage protein (TIGR01671 family)
MREIKFRAFDKTLGEMEYWEPFKYNDNDFIENEEYKDNLMQYTGLQDRNGNEIYEGDIVKCGNYPINIVKYYTDDSIGSCGCCVDAFEGAGFKIVEKGCVSDCEVIGNIYENKELLNGTS